ncbi:hypothetical protein CRG98_020667, partial [Punica granatum]
MASRTLRRRLHHGDVDGKSHEHMEASGLDSLDEPLLGSYNHDDRPSEGSSQDLWDDERRKQHLHWTLLFSQLITQWVQWLANMVIGSGSLIGRFFSIPFSTQTGLTRKFLQPALSLLQEERLRSLQQRLEVPFDGSRLQHQ